MALRFSCQYRYDGSFELDAGFKTGEGVTAVCGPSGSGKTTILSLIAGLLRPREGRIALGESVFVDTSNGVWLPPHRRAVGMVFQDSLLFPHRTVRANLTFGFGRGPGARPALERVAKVLELADLMERLPGTLSGGQARRVAIGRALLRGPRLLLLDEPWAGLDEELKDRITRFLERCLAEWRIPTLLVSHDRASVGRLADRIINIRDGRVIVDGDRGDGPVPALEEPLPLCNIRKVCAPQDRRVRLWTT